VTPGTGCCITLTTHEGATVRLLTLTREQAERASKVALWGRERLLITDAHAVPDGDRLLLYSVDEPEVSLLVYPPPEAAPGVTEDDADGLFARFRAAVPRKDLRYVVELVDASSALVTVPPEILDGVDDAYLRVHYLGDIGSLFIDGKMVADNFYNGAVWEIGLRRFMRASEPTEILIQITPLRSRGDAPRLIATGMAFRPDTVGEGMVAIHHVSAVPQYKIVVPTGV
jgi:hypothetical protein